MCIRCGNLFQKTVDKWFNSSYNHSAMKLNKANNQYVQIEGMEQFCVLKKRSKYEKRYST